METDLTVEALTHAEATVSGDRMGLAFYNSDKEIFTPSSVNGLDKLRSFHDGHLGDTWEDVIYLRNDDPTKYFTNMVLYYLIDGYQDMGEFGDTGWGVKLMYGERQPTEAEWDLVKAGDPLSLPDIGNSDAADTSTYHPIWVRITCPGGQLAQIRQNQKLRLLRYPRVVGA